MKAELRGKVILEKERGLHKIAPNGKALGLSDVLQETTVDELNK